MRYVPVQDYVLYQNKINFSSHNLHSSYINIYTVAKMAKGMGRRRWAAAGSRSAASSAHATFELRIGRIIVFPSEISAALGGDRQSLPPTRPIPETKGPPRVYHWDNFPNRSRHARISQISFHQNQLTTFRFAFSYQAKLF